MTLNLKILGIPLSKQSARFKVMKGKSGSSFVKSYQKKEVVDNERNIAFDVKSQLPLGFVPFDRPIGAKVLFVFPPLKNFSKKKMSELESGTVIHKDTKPDLTDNLMKGVFDAMEGIVFTNDSRICEVSSKKIYGFVPRTEIELFEL